MIAFFPTAKQGETLELSQQDLKDINMNFQRWDVYSLAGRGGGKVVRAAKTFVLLPVEAGNSSMIGFAENKTHC